MHPLLSIVTHSFLGKMPRGHSGKIQRRQKRPRDVPVYLLLSTNETVDFKCDIQFPLQCVLTCLGSLRFIDLSKGIQDIFFYLPCSKLNKSPPLWEDSGMCWEKDGPLFARWTLRSCCRFLLFISASSKCFPQRKYCQGRGTGMH